MSFFYYIPRHFLGILIKFKISIMKNLFAIILLSFTVQNIYAQGQENDEMNFLFVQTAENVTYKDGLLTLKQISPTTLFFTDRPDRLAGHMTTIDFLSEWDEGDNSFAEDPPNAVISIFHENDILDVVVTLKNPKSDGKNLVYDVDVLDGVLPATGNACSLFIDPVGRPASPTSVAGVERRSTKRHVAAATH